MVASLRILVLEPYWGGSHRAFLEGWKARSRHRFTVLAMPARHWKWRMRGAAVTLSRQAAAQSREGGTWDVLLCSDMLNLAEFAGLVPAALAGLPRVVYFHENQITYPDRAARERDVHFGLTNITTALAADRVWFNSAFHRDAFLAGAGELVASMPDCHFRGAGADILARSAVHPPGVDAFPPRDTRPPGPLHVAWAARWEHDKNPDLFFEALFLLADQGLDFRVSVLGQTFRETPPVFARAREVLSDRIVHWGTAERDEYRRVLGACDVFVSTADHEFFGIAVLEAARAGAFPVVVDRLAYPETLDRDANPDFFFQGGPRELAARLAGLAAEVEGEGLWGGDAGRGRRTASRFDWDRSVPAYDDALNDLSGS